MSKHVFSSYLCFLHVGDAKDLREHANRAFSIFLCVSVCLLRPTLYEIYFRRVSSLPLWHRERLYTEDTECRRFVLVLLLLPYVGTDSVLLPRCSNRNQGCTTIFVVRPVCCYLCGVSKYCRHTVGGKYPMELLVCD